VERDRRIGLKMGEKISIKGGESKTGETRFGKIEFSRKSRMNLQYSVSELSVRKK
jgi:hypothetical protein